MPPLKASFAGILRSSVYGNAADQEGVRRGADNHSGGRLGPRCEGLETATESDVRLASAFPAKAASAWQVFGGHRHSARWHGA